MPFPKRCVCLLLALLLTLPLGAAALPEPGGDEPPKYLVGLNEPLDLVVPFSLQQEIVSADHKGSVYATSHPELLEDLVGEESIAYIEPNHEVHLLGITNDKHADHLWHLEYLQAETAWNQGLSGAGVRVGVLDSGLNPNHEDFTWANVEEGKNYCGGLDTVDNDGHGTFVSSVIAAKRNNGLGVAGLTDEVTLVPLKILDQDKGFSHSIIAAIYDSVDVYNCDVLNMSFGTRAFSQAIANAVSYAVSKGVLVVCAVGNDGNDVENYPAALPDTVGVGFFDSLGVIDPHSQRNTSVDVTAPGTNIAGAYIDELEPATAYRMCSGSSMASPMVASMAIMAKQLWPGINQAQFTALLTQTARDAGAAGYDTSYGHGMVDLPAFLAAVKDAAQREALLAPFTDVTPHWARENIGRVLQLGLMNGTGSTVFSPDTPTTRYMAVTTLARLSGDTLQGYPNPFSDVPANSWFSDPVCWAANNGIVNGTGGDAFSGDDTLTRQQLAAMLYRYADYAGADLSVSTDRLAAYPDAGSVAGWAKTAMNWCVDRGILQGSGGALSPTGSATRAQLATMLMRMHDLLGGESQ